MVLGNGRSKYSTFGIVVLLAAVLLFFLCFQQEACAVENPQQLRAETASVSPSAVGLKWHVASGKKIAAYDVYKVSGHKKKLKTVSSATKTYKAKKLKKGKTYKFRIVASLKDGSKIASNEVSVKTGKAKKTNNVKTITFPKGPIKIGELRQQRINVGLKSYNGKAPLSKKVTYWSSDKSVAKISKDGLIDAVSVGSCTVYGVAHNGKMTSVRVSVFQGIPVLGYHGVATSWEKQHLYGNDRFTITTATFEKQIKRLHDKGYRSVTCDEFYKWQKGKIELPRKSVLITFDDARYVAVKNAPAILRKYGMKSTWFVIGKRTSQSSSEELHRYTATVDDLREMADKYPETDLESHSFGLHEIDDKTGKAVIFSKTKADVLKDCDRQTQFAQELGIKGFSYYAYPYGFDPVVYREGVKMSGAKMAFDFGNDRLATRIDDGWSVPRVGVRATTSEATFNQFVR